MQNAKIFESFDGNALILVKTLGHTHLVVELYTKLVLNLLTNYCYQRLAHVHENKWSTSRIILEGLMPEWCIGVIGYVASILITDIATILL